MVPKSKESAEAGFFQVEKTAIIRPYHIIIGGAVMAKKVTGYIKLQIPAGKATPAPPVGPALGQHGVIIVEFTKQFNA